MDFSAIPPEINSGLMYAGPGPGGLIGAGQAWNTLSQDLSSTATAYGSVITDLATTWAGPSSQAMMTAVQPYLGWMVSTAELAGQSAVAANAAAAAFSAAFTATVPPPIIAANRTQLTMLVVTNLLGQNTPAIAANEAAYAEMWAQDAAAMNTYAANSTAAAAGLPQFTPAPQTTNPAAMPAAAVPAQTTLLEFIQQLIPGFTPGDPLGNLADLLLSPLGVALLSSGAWVDAPIALLVGLLGFSMITAATQESARAIANAGHAIGYGGNANVVIPATEPVKAATGAGGNIRGMSIPPSWARPPESKPPQVTVDTPTRERYQAAIPAVPFMPVTGLRSNQGKVRTQPEYGHVSKILPPRHPAGG